MGTLVAKRTHERGSSWLHLQLHGLDRRIAAKVHRGEHRTSAAREGFRRPAPDDDGRPEVSPSQVAANCEKGIQGFVKTLIRP